MEIWDLQTPSSPQQISGTALYYFGVEVPVVSVAAAGDYAYFANLGAGLRLFAVSDKTNPIEIGFDDSDAATNVLVSGNYAYVRAGNASFRVVDISSANNPVAVGTFDPGSTGGGGGNIAPIGRSNWNDLRWVTSLSEPGDKKNSTG